MDLATCLKKMELVGVLAVSYTHLDVYKRQAWHMGQHLLRQEL